MKRFFFLCHRLDRYSQLACVQYIRPAIQTLVIGQACGNACMLLAAGEKGKRASLPHSRIKMAPPRINRSFGRTVDLMIKANELDLHMDKYVHWMSTNTGQTKEKVLLSLSCLAPLSRDTSPCYSAVCFLPLCCCYLLLAR